MPANNGIIKLQLSGQVGDLLSKLQPWLNTFDEVTLELQKSSPKRKVGAKAKLSRAIARDIRREFEASRGSMSRRAKVVQLAKRHKVADTSIYNIIARRSYS